MKRNLAEKKESRNNGLIRLLHFKKAIRECIQNGADNYEMQRIADQHGFTFAKPF